MSLRSRKRRRWVRWLAREGWLLIRLRLGRVYVAPRVTEEARRVQGMLDASPMRGAVAIVPFGPLPPP